MVIGIICDYDEKQIDKQKLIINKIYKENSEDKFVDYIIKIIEKNKLKVLIAAIKDQQICGYPLGYGDFLIDKLNLKKRIDINYFNKKVCDGKYNSTELKLFAQNYHINLYLSIFLKKLMKNILRLKEIMKISKK